MACSNHRASVFDLHRGYLPLPEDELKTYARVFQPGQDQTRLLHPANNKTCL